MQGSSVGVGSALRKVRASRGLTLDEAARDTRIRREFLEAIEDEDFHRLLGDVHIRGCLRTYASYLRLEPEKVVEVYATARPDETPVSPPRPPAAPEPQLWKPRRRDSHRLFVLAAATALVLASAFGILSARQPAPPPAEALDEAPLVEAEVVGVSVAVLARQPVEVTIVADGGEPQTFALAQGEGRSFGADRWIKVRLSEGGTARVTLNGTDESVPGTRGQPWEATFGDATTPSPSTG